MKVFQEQPWKGKQPFVERIHRSFISLWTESLCGCLNDIPLCCYGCWCCCCLYGHNAAKLTSQPACWIHCTLYSLMSAVGCCCLLHTIRRGQMREKYSLEEGDCGDCMITCCCPSCAICQETREMKVRGKTADGPFERFTALSVFHKDIHRRQ